LTKSVLKNHLEWIVFAGGLCALAFMDPSVNGVSLCLIEQAGIPFCPGDGLGHSISYTFRGDWGKALDAHFMGPAAVIILILRILYLWKNLLTKSIKQRNGVL